MPAPDHGHTRLVEIIAQLDARMDDHVHQLEQAAARIKSLEA